MKSMFSFAQGETPFYNPADSMFYLEGEERAAFEGWKKNGALIGIIAVLVGLAIVIFGVMSGAPIE
ncbi:MAG TPA: hypothetical protein VHS59_07915 [Bacillota bacterium]|nr:hypothetical protein [Bacillota bacterium]